MPAPFGYRKAGNIKIICDGQSFNFAPTVALSYPRKLMAQLPGFYRMDEVAMGGTGWSYRQISIQRRTLDKIPLNGDTCILMDTGGQTDIYQAPGLNKTAAQTLADAETYWTAAKAAGVDFIIAATVPKSTIYDADGETQRGTLNGLIAASSLVDEVADIAASPGAANASDVAKFYDGLHPTEELVDEWVPIYKAAIAALGFRTS
jgi:hypothetical protein